MGKIIVTQEQAEAINSCKKDDMDRGEAIRHHINTWCAPPNRCLNELSLDELVRALYVGYEVEEKFEVGDKVFYRTMDTGMHTIIDMQAGICNLRGSVKLTNVETSSIRHATESEIAGEEKSRMDKKINKIWIDLSDYERNGLHKKLVRGGY